jgi:hypothetical protein
MCVAALAGGPLGAAPAFAQPAPAQVAQSQTGTTVSGTAVDQNGAPLRDVVVTLKGPQTYTATSDGSGAFEIDGVEPGVYTATATRGGYDTITADTVVVTPGESSVSLNPALAAQSYTSIKTIGRTSNAASLHAGFNTSAAAIQTVSQQTFQDQAQTQIVNVLNQIPGVYTESPNVGGNDADPGAIRFTSIRGSFGNETQALLDGHPMSNGQYGDFVSSFLNSFLLQSVEVVKGPGASAPQVINGIGGTVNFRTLDPTPNFQSLVQQGYNPT